MDWSGTAIVSIAVPTLISGLTFTWLVWHLRDTYEMKARSPYLLLLTGIACCYIDAVVFAEAIYLHKGEEFSCRMTLWSSYIAGTLLVVPYVLRAMRLAVMYNPEYRKAFGKHMQLRNLMGVVFACTAIMVAFAGAVQAGESTYSDNESGCDFFAEWGLFVALLVGQVACSTVLARKMANIDDALGVRRECQQSACAGAVLLFFYVGYKILVKAGAWAEEDQPDVAVGWIFVAFTWACMTISFLLPLSKFYVKHVLHPEQVGGDKTKRMSAGAGLWSMAEVLEHPEMNPLFTAFANKNLCSESIDFLQALIQQYDTVPVTDGDAQYKVFVNIVKNFVLQGSPQEVNISSKCRLKIESVYKQGAWGFLKLNVDSRNKLLEAARDDVLVMLSQNLLAKFKETEDFHKTATSIAEHDKALWDMQALDEEAQVMVGGIMGNRNASHSNAKPDPSDRKSNVTSIEVKNRTSGLVSSLNTPGDSRSRQNTNTK